MLSNNHVYCAQKVIITLQSAPVTLFRFIFHLIVVMRIIERVAFYHSFDMRIFC